MSLINRIGRVRINGTAGLSGMGSGWFGYGQDGEMSVPEGEIVTIPVEEDIGFIRKNYTDVTIAKDAILKPSARNNSTILLVKGNLVVNGTLDVSKCAPLANDSENMVRRQAHIVLANSAAPEGSFSGGNGGAGGMSGGRGGIGFWNGGGYGGGGTGGDWLGGDSEPRPPKGISWPWRGVIGSKQQQYGCGGSRGTPEDGALGGAAPGGSPAYWYTIYNERDGSEEEYLRSGLDGDAYGGGALWIFVQGDVIIGPTGKILANGGMGAEGTSDYHHNVYDLGNGHYETNVEKYTPLGSGGSGGGGIIFITYGGTFTNFGTIAANGGAQPQAKSPECRGQAGDTGTVKIISFQDLMRGA